MATSIPVDIAVRPRISPFRQALLSFFWLAQNTQWAAVLIVLMPSQIKSAVGNDIKGSALGLALGIGAFISMVAAPIFGALSDRIRLPGGRRKPWVILGTLGSLVGLYGMAVAIRAGDPSSLIPWTIAFMLLELFSNVATGPYAALIPDLVPADQRGSASGWMGLMTVLGTFIGGLFGFMIGALGGITGVYFLVMGVLALGMLVTIWGVKEPAQYAIRPFIWREFWRGLFDPFKHSDFTWVFFTRFLVTMGIFTVQEFLQYFLGDAVGAPYSLPGIGKVADTPEVAVSFFLLPLLFGSILSSLAAGVLSDRYGRKVMVYIAGAMMGAVAAIFIVFHSFTLAVLMGVVFGLGYGAYESVDWALASDVLPSMDDYAKDMGVWHVAMVLPQVIATPIAGALLDNFQRIGIARGLPTLGYSVIFSLSVIYFILGSVFVSRIKGAR